MSSWFTRPFSSPPAPAQEEESPPPDRPADSAKGVKEDLSELTSTFTRQLWGVASFLAPPPHSQSDSINPQIGFPASGSVSDHHSQFDSPDDPLDAANKETSSDEPVPDDCLPSMDQTPDTMPDLSNPHRVSLTGIGKDLAELKGSVAIGFSRIMKVMREEIERDQLAHDVSASSPEDESGQYADEPENPSDKSQLPGINSLLRPLFGSILHGDKGTSLTKEDIWDEEDKESRDGNGHESSHSTGVRSAFKLPSTLGDGLDGISKFASGLFPVSVESDEEDLEGVDKDQQAAGITEEVLTFAKNISMHPETWLDFPLFSDDEDDDDFEMSDAQKEHVTQVELASPRLAALRIELCPDYMNESRFWKIYFVLLHSRLTRKDAVLLSTPQIAEARALLLRKLQKSELKGSGNMLSENEESSRAEMQEQVVGEGSHPLSIKASEGGESFQGVSQQAVAEGPLKEFHQIKDVTGSSDIKSQIPSLSNDSAEEIQNKNVLESTIKFAALRYDEEEADADKWLNEEPSPHSGSAAGLANDEDVSFSDLEEEDDSKSVESSNPKRSGGWVQLNTNQNAGEVEGLGLSSNRKVDSVGKTSPAKTVLLQVSSNQSLGDASKKIDKGESSDWWTVEEDDVACPDFP